MKNLASHLALAATLLCMAGARGQTQTPAQLLALPLNERVRLRAGYKAPALAAYHRQMALRNKDCDAESQQGQQPYNICMGQATVQADKDFTEFYRDLEMLMFTLDDLRRLHETQSLWLPYRDRTSDAAHDVFSGGTAAPGEGSAAYLMITRDRMSELYRIYSLNFAQ